MRRALGWYGLIGASVFAFMLLMAGKTLYGLAIVAVLIIQEMANAHMRRNGPDWTIVVLVDLLGWGVLILAFYDLSQSNNPADLAEIRANVRQNGALLEQIFGGK